VKPVEVNRVEEWKVEKIEQKESKGNSKILGIMEGIYSRT